MRLKDILHAKGSKVWTVKENQTIHEALQILITHKIGALVVMGDRHKIKGMLSERDIVRGCQQNIKKLDSMQVGDLMTREVITASLNDEIGEIMAVMTEKRVRHIPVLDAGELVGLVSIGDVVKSLLQDSEHQIRFLKEYLYGSGA